VASIKNLTGIVLVSLLVACGRGPSPSAAAGAQEAALSPSAEPAADGGMVVWLAAPAQKVAKATEEVEEHRRMHGREEPVPELLQPMLDPALPDYVPRTDIAIKGKFHGTSSDIMPRLVEKWEAAFNAIYPEAEFEITPPYAGSTGMLKVIDGELDFAFVSRELKPTDITSFQEKYGYEPFYVSISGGVYRHFGFLDAIGIITNKDNPIEGISLDDLDSLFSTTRNRGGSEVRTWGDLGLTGEWKDQPIIVHAIEPWNGFEEFVRQKVMNASGKHGEWRPDLDFHKLAFDPASEVAKDKFSIGYTGLAYIDTGVKVLPLSEHRGGDYIEPSYENVASFEYPLSRTMYFAANVKPSEKMDPAMEEFLKFILSRQGQEIVREHAIFLPLREPQVAEGLARIAEH